MSLCRFNFAKLKRCCPEVSTKFEWRPWFWAAFAMICLFALACCCSLLLPGQTMLVKNIAVSAAGGDARYWSRGQWRADAITLEFARRWMLDSEPREVVESEATAPTMLVTTNSDLFKPAV